MIAGVYTNKDKEGYVTLKVLNESVTVLSIEDIWISIDEYVPVKVGSVASNKLYFDMFKKLNEEKLSHIYKGELVVSVLLNNYDCLLIDKDGNCTIVDKFGNKVNDLGKCEFMK